MKTLQEIKQQLSNNIEQDLQILNTFLFLDTKTEEEFFNKIEICKYMKELASTKDELYELYRNNFSQIDVEFFKYIYSRVNTKHGKKQWELMLFYINKAIWYFDLPKKELSFDCFEDYYIYTYLMQDTKIQFYMGVESWIYYEQALIYKNLGNLDIAISTLKYCIECSPMNFAYYEQLFSCLERAKRFKELKEELINSHKTIKTIPQLSVFYYYWSIYFYNLGNYSVSKTCAYFSTKYNLVFTYRNKLAEIVDAINTDEKIVTPYFNIKPEEVLKKYNIPTWFSETTMKAVLSLYSKCVSKQIADKQILKQSRNMLVSFKMKDYAEEVATNIISNDNMYHFDTYEISFKLNKNWKLVDLIDSRDFQEGTVFFALNNNDDFTIFIKSFKDKDYQQLCDNNIEQLKLSGFKIVSENDFTTLNKRNIKLNRIKLDENTNMFSAFLNIKDLYFCNIYMTFKDDFEARKKEFFKILNSINTFCSINHQDN